MAKNKKKKKKEDTEDGLLEDEEEVQKIISEESTKNGRRIVDLSQSGIWNLVNSPNPEDFLNKIESHTGDSDETSYDLRLENIEKNLQEVKKEAEEGTVNIQKINDLEEQISEFKSMSQVADLSYTIEEKSYWLIEKLGPEKDELEESLENLKKERRKIKRRKNYEDDIEKLDKEINYLQTAHDIRRELLLALRDENKSPLDALWNYVLFLQEQELNFEKALLSLAGLKDNTEQGLGEVVEKLEEFGSYDKFNILDGIFEATKAPLFELYERILENAENAESEDSARKVMNDLATIASWYPGEVEQRREMVEELESRQEKIESFEKEKSRADDNNDKLEERLNILEAENEGYKGFRQALNNLSRNEDLLKYIKSNYEGLLSGQPTSTDVLDMLKSLKDSEEAINTIKQDPNFHAYIEEHFKRAYDRSDSVANIARAVIFMANRWRGLNDNYNEIQELRKSLQSKALSKESIKEELEARLGVKDLKKELSVKSSECDQLNERKEAVEKELEGTKSKYNEIDDKLKASEKTIEELQQKSDDYQEIFNNSLSENEELKERYDDLERQSAEINILYNSIVEEKQRLESLNENQRSSLEAVQQERNELNERVEVSEEEKANLEQRIGELSQEVEGLKNSRTYQRAIGLEEKIEDLEKELSDKTAEVSNVEQGYITSRNKTFRSLLDDAEELIDTYGDQLQDIDAYHSKRQIEIYRDIVSNKEQLLDKIEELRHDQSESYKFKRTRQVLDKLQNIYRYDLRETDYEVSFESIVEFYQNINKAAVEIYKVKSEELVNNKDELEELVNNKDEEIRGLRISRDELTEEKSCLEQSLQNTNERICSLLITTSQLSNEIENQRTQYEEEISENQSLIDSQREENEEQEEQIEGLEERTRNQALTIGELEEESLQNHMHRQELEERNEGLERRYRARTSAFNIMRDRYNDERYVHDQTIVDLRNELGRRIEEYEEQEEQIEGLNNVVEDLNSERDTLQERVDSQAEQIEGLVYNLEQERGKNQFNSAKADDLQSERDWLVDENSNLNEIIDNIKRRALDMAASRRIEFEKQKELMDENNEQLRGYVDEIIRHIYLLDEDSEHMRDYIDELEARTGGYFDRRLYNSLTDIINNQNNVHLEEINAIKDMVQSLVENRETPNAGNYSEEDNRREIEDNNGAEEDRQQGNIMDIINNLNNTRRENTGDRNYSDNGDDNNINRNNPHDEEDPGENNEPNREVARQAQNTSANIRDTPFEYEFNPIQGEWDKGVEGYRGAKKDTKKLIDTLHIDITLAHIKSLDSIRDEHGRIDYSIIYTDSSKEQEFSEESYKQMVNMMKVYGAENSNPAIINRFMKGLCGFDMPDLGRQVGEGIDLKSFEKFRDKKFGPVEKEMRAYPVFQCLRREDADDVVEATGTQGRVNADRLGIGEMANLIDVFDQYGEIPEEFLADRRYSARRAA